MTNITIYDTEAERLNEAAAKVGESVATALKLARDMKKAIVARLCLNTKHHKT